MSGVPIVSHADIRRVWLDESLSVADAAASLGLTCHALCDRAQRRDLPPRKRGRRFAVPVVEFTELWNAGVSPSDLQKRYGTPWRTTLAETARRFGLRSFGRNERRISLADYQQMKLAQALTASAAETRAAMAAQKRAG